MAVFDNFAFTLDNWGVSDVLLPFLLVFTIVYAVLAKTKILGEAKNLNIVLAIVLGLVFVIPHVTGGFTTYDPVLVINQALPSVSIVAIAIIMVLILVGLFGVAPGWSGPLTTWIMISAVAAVVIIFGSAVGWWSGWNWFTDLFGQDAVSLVVILLVFGIIIAFITGGGKTQGDKVEGIFSKLGEFFKKP